MKKNIYYLFVIAFCFTDCVGYQHTPTPHYVVANSEKGQTYVIAGWQSLQLGYNITDRFNIFANGYHAKNPSSAVKSSDYDGYSFYDFTKNFFNDLGSNNNNSNNSNNNSINPHPSDTVCSDITSKVEIGFGYFLPDLSLNKRVSLHYGVQIGIGSGQIKYNSSNIKQKQ